MRRTQLTTRRSLFPYLLLGPSILLVLVVFCYPLVYSLSLSLQSWNLLELGPRVFIGLKNYSALITEPRFLNSLSTTLLFLMGTVSVQFVIGFALALLLNKSVAGRNFLRTLICLPMTLAAVVVGLLWMWLLDPNLGMVNYYLRRLGFEARSFLGDPSLALASVILIDAWRNVPFTFLALLAGIQRIPPEMYEACRIDGASFWTMLTRVTIPLLRPIVVVVLLLKIMDAMKTFDLIFVLTQGGPGICTETLSMLAYKVGLVNFDVGAGAAIATSLVIVTLLVTVVYGRQSLRSDGVEF